MNGHPLSSVIFQCGIIPYPPVMNGPYLSSVIFQGMDYTMSDITLSNFIFWI